MIVLTECNILIRGANLRTSEEVAQGGAVNGPKDGILIVISEVANIALRIKRLC